MYIVLLIISAIVLYNIFFDRKKYIAMNQKVINCSDCVIKNEKKAIEIAEDKLFVIYGESKIKDERPYSIKLINNKVWVITGSLNHSFLDELLYKGVPKFGGGFEIKINAKDGKIIKLTHYK
jgi:hypothetical protein